MSRSKGRLTLPDNPNLEQLREQAKDRLAIIRSHAPEAQLSDAQFALARDYGFSGWRALKAEIDRLSGDVNALVGFYAQPSISNNIVSVTAKASRLFLTVGQGATIEIVPQADGAFAAPGLTRRYRFERDGRGKARALITQTEAGATVRSARVDATKAAQIVSAREEAAKAQWRDRTPVAISVDALERCVGHYANPLGQVMEFSRDDQRLFMESGMQRRAPLDAESQTDFFLSPARIELRFHGEGDVAASVTVRRLGSEAKLSRISAEAAADLNAAVARRVAEQAHPRQLAAPVPADILARYAGRYRMEKSMEMAIDVTDGHLFAQMLTATGKPPRWEIFPESQTKFFWTAMPAQVSFFPDSDGHVSHAVFHQAGQLIPMSRVEDPAEGSAPSDDPGRPLQPGARVLVNKVA